MKLFLRVSIAYLTLLLYTEEVIGTSSTLEIVSHEVQIEVCRFIKLFQNPDESIDNEIESTYDLFMKLDFSDKKKEECLKAIKATLPKLNLEQTQMLLEACENLYLNFNIKGLIDRIYYLYAKDGSLSYLKKVMIIFEKVPSLVSFTREDFKTIKKIVSNKETYIKKNDNISMLVFINNAFLKRIPENVLNEIIRYTLSNLIQINKIEDVKPIIEILKIFYTINNNFNKCFSIARLENWINLSSTEKKNFNMLDQKVLKEIEIKFLDTHRKLNDANTYDISAFEKISKDYEKIKNLRLKDVPDENKCIIIWKILNKASNTWSGNDIQLVNNFMMNKMVKKLSNAKIDKKMCQNYTSWLNIARSIASKTLKVYSINKKYKRSTELSTEDQEFISNILSFYGINTSTVNEILDSKERRQYHQSILDFIEGNLPSIKSCNSVMNIIEDCDGKLSLKQVNTLLEFGSKFDFLTEVNKGFLKDYLIYMKTLKNWRVETLRKFCYDFLIINRILRSELDTNFDLETINFSNNKQAIHFANAIKRKVEYFYQAYFFFNYFLWKEARGSRVLDLPTMLCTENHINSRYKKLLIIGCDHEYNELTMMAFINSIFNANSDDKIRYRVFIPISKHLISTITVYYNETPIVIIFPPAFSRAVTHSERKGIEFIQKHCKANKIDMICYVMPYKIETLTNRDDYDYEEDFIFFSKNRLKVTILATPIGFKYYNSLFKEINERYKAFERNVFGKIQNCQSKYQISTTLELFTIHNCCIDIFCKFRKENLTSDENLVFELTSSNISAILSDLVDSNASEAEREI
ncbi:hypothetical protein GINT2_001031 [Glugoides intestinalis]